MEISGVRVCMILTRGITRIIKQAEAAKEL